MAIKAHHFRSFIAAVVFGVVLLAPTHGRCVGRADLDAAFLATFGQHAPVIRFVQRPIRDTSEPPKVVGAESLVLNVRPEYLVPMSDHKYALISYEIDQQDGHSASGAIAVAYLKRTANRWKLEHLWPELLYSGVGGQPANAGAETHRFGSDSLFFARSAWCGMGECSEWIGVIRLSRSHPVAYDGILAGATLPAQGSPVDDESTCENYDVGARIVSPRHSGSLFSIRYEGWTAAPGTLFPRTPLHLLTSYVPNKTVLVMQPVVPVPTCGR